MSFATTASGTFIATRGHQERGNGGLVLDRATRCPCLGLALAAGSMLWVGLGSTLFLLLA